MRVSLPNQLRDKLYQQQLQHLEEQQLDFSRIIMERQPPLQCNNGTSHRSRNRKENAVIAI